ncbi:minor capsid protein [Bacillus sp. CLL-7-23]|uniref:Minor capsid protein n=1 Tax=Bacillus changyiensis TaxID=3004103 RepID=A0ABT4X8C0_9BACI|nr:phage minor capsid protein [Bacillus changyiensis]MDA1477276.1 minor capsid protein [Bacillus changyiensis]MDA7028516.1 minor capsid protein [Bacillus changyiensis]
MTRLNRNQLEQMTWPIAKIYTEIQTEILEGIATALAEDQGALEDDANAWHAMKLEQIGPLRKQAIKIIARKSGLKTSKVTEILLNVGLAAIDSNESLLKRALKAGAPLIEAPKPRDDPAIWRVLESFERQSSSIFNMINSSMLNNSEQVYRDILTKATADVITGMKTPQEALRRTMGSWAERGIPTLIKRNGDRMYAEEYASQVMRTMGNRVANDMQDSRFDSWGVDLVEISSHEGARPNCAPYQGQIYSRSGNDPNYPALSDTSIGEPDGLFGINCGHFQYPYIPGVSTQRYHPVDEEKNEEVYEDSQKQRQFERFIRKGKRELAVFEKLNDEVGIKRAQTKISRRQAQLREFIDETGRTRRRDREQIYFKGVS